MKRTGNFVLLIVKELSLFPLAQSIEPLMSKVLPFFDFVLHQSTQGINFYRTSIGFRALEYMLGTGGNTGD